MQGFIKLHREIFDSDLWNDVTTYRLFTYLLLHASHQDGIKIGGIELKRGQWIRSTRKLAEDLSYKEGRGLKKYSTKTINKCIHKLVNSERVSIEETELGTLFTIVNYAIYQDSKGVENETVNGSVNEGETNGKRSGNNNKNAKNARMQEDNKYIVALFEHYVSKGIIVHTKLTEPMKSAIRGRLKDYSFEELKQAIDNYAAVYKSDMHWFNTKYALADLMRDKDVRKFIDAAEPLNNFRERDFNQSKSQNRQQIEYDPNKHAF